MKNLSGGDACGGHTRSHPEHDGEDPCGRWYYAGDGMEEQAAARHFLLKQPCQAGYRLAMREFAGGKRSSVWLFQYIDTCFACDEQSGTILRGHSWMLMACKTPEAHTVYVQSIP